MALTRNRLIGNLANATDSAASSSFLAKGATEANYQSIAYSDVTSKPTILDSAGITSIIDSAYIQARQGSAVAGLDSASITAIVDSNYVVARAANSGSGYVRYNYTATAGQTVFQDSDNSGALLSYTSGGIMVFYNGVMLKNTADWEGTDGSSVTLVEAADSGANVSIHKWTVTASGSSTAFYGDRGVIMGGANVRTASYNNIGYIDITSTGNATDFGDMSSTRAWLCAVNNGTYAVSAGGYDWATSSSSTVIDYVTVATPGNATDFGDMLTLRYGTVGISDGTYGILAGGYDTSAQTTTIEYITVASPGNASDFGDMTLNKSRAASASDGSRGIIAGGFDTGFSNHIDYITTATPGNATDFGDLTEERYEPQGVHDETYGVFSGGDAAVGGTAGPCNVIDYITIQTPSNATDFGDLTTIREKQGGTGCTNATRGVFLCGSNNSGSPTTSNNINTLDYITIATPGNATDFGDHTVSCQYAPGTSGSPS